MIKYQLERIKDMYSGISDPDRLDGIPVVTVAQSDIEWLIEQAERVEEYRSSLEHGAMVAVKTAEKLHHQQQENKRYREALEKIAFKQFNVEPKRVVVKLQSIARQALEGEE